MGAAITAILAMLAQIAGTASEVSTISKIVETLVQIVPALVSEAKALVPMVKGIIAALSSNPTTTPAQLETLKALDAQVDADFEAAATAAQAEDDAADLTAANQTTS